MDTATQTVDLTPAEIELVKAKRAKEAAEAAEKAAQEKIEIEKKITAMKKEHDAFIAKTKMINNAAISFHNEFEAKAPGKYQLINTRKEKNFTASTFQYLNGSHTNVVHATLTADYDESKIVLKSDPEKYFVNVEENVLYSSNSYHSHEVGREFVMTFGGSCLYTADRKYKSVATVMKKIDEDISKKNQKVAAEQNRKTNDQKLADILTSKYNAPFDAEVKIEQHYTETHYDDRGRYLSHPIHKPSTHVSVTFKNGLSVWYQPQVKNEEILPAVYKINSYGKLGMDTIINALSNINND